MLSRQLRLTGIVLCSKHVVRETPIFPSRVLQDSSFPHLDIYVFRRFAYRLEQRLRGSDILGDVLERQAEAFSVSWIYVLFTLQTLKPGMNVLHCEDHLWSEVSNSSSVAGAHASETVVG